MDRTWFILNNVSHYWRLLVTKLINENIELDLSTISSKSQWIIRADYYNVFEMRVEITQYTKNACISLTSDLVELTKDQLESLNCVWPTDIVFPEVRLLTLKFEHIDDYYSDDELDPVFAKGVESSQYFRWIIERARSSFPGLSRLKLVYNHCVLAVFSRKLLSRDCNARLFLFAFSPMIRNYGVTSSASPNAAFISLLLENTPELTELNFSVNGSESDGFLVIGKSAATLESLTICDSNADVFRMLFVHADGRSIDYPRLRTLEILHVTKLDNDPLVDTSAVPFPVLQHFQADSCCGFVDDLPFRGNNNTLTSLHIALDARWERIFRQFEVFRIGKYPCLHNITVSHNHQRDLCLSLRVYKSHGQSTFASHIAFVI